MIVRWTHCRHFCSYALEETSKTVCVLRSLVEKNWFWRYGYGGSFVQVLAVGSSKRALCQRACRYTFIVDGGGKWKTSYSSSFGRHNDWWHRGERRSSAMKPAVIQCEEDSSFVLPMLAQIYFCNLRNSTSLMRTTLYQRIGELWYVVSKTGTWILQASNQPMFSARALELSKLETTTNMMFEIHKQSNAKSIQLLLIYVIRIWEWYRIHYWWKVQNITTCVCIHHRAITQCGVKSKAS